jgi:hypothetical protein
MLRRPLEPTPSHLLSIRPSSTLLLAVGLTTGLAVLLWPSMPWPMILTGWVVLAALSLVGAVRGWAYLRLYEIGPRRPSC